MSRIIKQSYVTMSEDKKVIQNIGEFNVLQPAVLEVQESAATRVVQEVAENLLQQRQNTEEFIQAESEGYTKPVDSQERAEYLMSYEEEAEKILEEARAGRAKIYEDAYKDGMQEAREELARRTAILEQEYQTKKEKLEEDLRKACRTEYEKEIHQLEGKMIMWMRGMLEKLVGQASQNENVLTHLIRMGMQEISLQGDLIIRVSEQDLDFVLQNKSKLTEELSEKLMIEILKDKNLQKNQCIIETIMGNIECSLDVQLKGITDELRLIYESIMKNVHIQ